MIMTRRNYSVIAVDAVVITMITAFIFCFIPPWLLILKTIPTGGDTASHYFTAWFVNHQLIPSGRISGWSMGNLGGFPMMQNYFPLPFVLMTALSTIMPLEIAFKLISVAGIFILPVSTWLFFRLLNQPSPVPVAGAIVTIPFLFMEGNTIWGANIPTTLAGPFCYSIGFSLTVVWLGLLYNAFNRNTGFLKCGFLLALIGFSHGYTLLFAGFASLFFILSPERFGENLKKLIIVHATAIGVMAFWLIPLIAFLPVTTKFGFVWIFPDFSHLINEVFPVITWPFIAISLITPIGLHLMFHRTVSKSPRKPLSFLLYLTFCGLGLYLAGYRVNLVDVRFLPFFQFFLIITGPLILAKLSLKPTSRIIISVPLLLLTCLWADHHETMIRSWAHHNYKGFESAPFWTHFSDINQFLKGTVSDPRVVYEHSTRHEKSGSLRAFESLPLFSGRSTLEGVYIQGSLNVPYIFYIQAELSKTPSMPLVDYTYPAFNLDKAAEHLKLFNVGHCIFTEPETVYAALNHPAYTLVKQSGPYSVFELLSNTGRYVVPLTYKPAMIGNSDYKQHFYRWFKQGQLDRPIGRIESPSPEDLNRFINISPDTIATEPAIPLPFIPLPVSETLTENTVAVRGVTPGHPYLIKISWHPNWKVTGADKIYMVSPAFMLIFPDSDTVTLTYGHSWPEITGGILTVITLLTLILSKTRYQSVFLHLNNLYESKGKQAARFLVPITACLSVISLFTITRDYPVSNYTRGLTHYSNQRYEQARTEFSTVIESHPNSIVSDEARFHYAMSWYLENQWNNAIDMFTQLISRYPDSRRTPESLYHMGLCHLSLNKPDKATFCFNSLVSNHPETSWAGFANLKLKELTTDDL